MISNGSSGNLTRINAKKRKRDQISNSKAQNGSNTSNDDLWTKKYRPSYMVKWWLLLFYRMKWSYKSPKSKSLTIICKESRRVGQACGPPGNCGTGQNTNSSGMTECGFARTCSTANVCDDHGLGFHWVLRLGPKVRGCVTPWQLGATYGA